MIWRGWKFVFGYLLVIACFGVGFWALLPLEWWRALLAFFCLIAAGVGYEIVRMRLYLERDGR
jgi:hypothetical protein